MLISHIVGVLGRSPGLGVSRLLVIAFAGRTTSGVHRQVQHHLRGRTGGHRLHSRVGQLTVTRVDAVRTFYRRLVGHCCCLVSLSPRFHLLASRARAALLRSRI